MKKARAGGPKLLWVEILEAKENVMFTEEQRAAFRFLRYSQKVPCAECGKRRNSVMWTMLCGFYAHTMTGFTTTKGKALAPLSPVCGEHLLSPAWPEEPERDPRRADNGDPDTIVPAPAPHKRRPEAKR